MARPRKFDTDSVLDAAMKVFWKKGYHGTTTDDLEAETGLKRGSLYNAFEDKRGLYLEVLDHYGRREMGEAAFLFLEARSFIEAIQNLMERAIKQTDNEGVRRGCLACDAAVEQAPRDPEVASRVQVALDLLRRAIVERLREEGGWSVSLEAEADHITSTYMGLRVFAKAGYPIIVLQNILNTSVERYERASGKS
ncbi:TetR/AcrR family transcriptional regulator [Kiloniella sp.]|uniref:TetR/AcrR family transcriptional regulator n=1 Tax=Kiloniella sp. TaxID=1938587 RepID=UPI003B01996E